MIWSKTDRPARMVVEVAATERFRGPRRRYAVEVGPDTDYTGKVQLTGLPAGTELFYRVRFAENGNAGHSSEPLVGTLPTAPTDRRDVSFAWSGDVAGQGWGINPDTGGMTGFEAVRQLDPDFFLHSGDSIYADGPLQESVTLPDGTVWRNLVTPEKSKVAETLAEYRGQFRYNLLDENVRRFAAQVPQFVQWDDHEVTNNWYPGEVLGDTGGDSRYTVKDVDTLAARARQAFLEYMPISGSRIDRSLPYGPLVDVFALDLRPTAGPTRPIWLPAGRRPSSSVAISWRGSPRSCGRPVRCGRSSRPTCRSAWWSRTDRSTRRASPTATPVSRPGASSSLLACCRI